MGPARLTQWVGVGRLAPQDYHRYHAPCTGVFERLRDIGTFLYTVNPMAVREDIDVYTENKRVIATIASPQFGKIVCVIIGAPPHTERERERGG
jgi:phosphatidylserine decarboxylase